MNKPTDQQNRYKNLIVDIGGVLEKGRRQTYQFINNVLVRTYWEIGRLIIEFEQKGKAKADYGVGLLKKISKNLTQRFGKGFSVDNLENMRRFYLTYSKSETLSRKSKKSSTVLRKFQPTKILPDKLLKLSWSHYVRLMSIKNPSERNFYEIECIANNWSVRELNRQFDSSLYERLALSRNKKDVKKLASKGQIIEKPADSLKDPYVLEFLKLKERSEYSETDLETAIIDDLEKFLLELGKGFAFVGRQKRISFGADHFYIDLVFYNRLLRCFVLVDLKIGKLKHQDIGQMQMYVNIFDREIKTKDENPTVGLILCKEKDELVVKYTLPKNNKQIFAKEYQLYLPKKEELQREVKRLVKRVLNE